MSYTLQFLHRNAWATVHWKIEKSHLNYTELVWYAGEAIGRIIDESSMLSSDHSLKEDRSRD